MQDPYSYEGTNVLKNKLGIIDPGLLNEAERNLTASRIIELRDNPISGNFDLQHLQDIHKYIFQDVYEWAGQIRNINIEKQTGFCLYQYIEEEQKRIFSAIGKEDNLTGLNLEQFADRAAYYLGEINALHPFREGNGRAQCEFMSELAENAGWQLNLENITQEKMIPAAIDAFNGKYDTLASLIKENIKPADYTQQKEWLDRIDAISNVKEKPAIFERDPNPVREYQNLFKSLSSNMSNIDGKLDLTVASKMLGEGFKHYEVSKAISEASPLAGVSKGSINDYAQKIVQQALKLPESQSLTKDITMGMKR